MLIEDYEISLAAAGFDAVQIIDSRQDLNAYAELDEPSNCCEPSSCCGTSADEVSVHQGLTELLGKFYTSRGKHWHILKHLKVEREQGGDGGFMGGRQLVEAVVNRGLKVSVVRMMS
jgi:hypothetical protein